MQPIAIPPLSFLEEEARSSAGARDYEALADESTEHLDSLSGPTLPLDLD